MKWILGFLAVLLICALGWLPFRGTDIATLEPAEVLYVSTKDGYVYIEIDGGWFGEGETVADAVLNLKETTPGQVFLQTVDFLLITQDDTQMISDLYPYLRMGCGICITEEKPDLSKVAAYLRAHRTGLTLQNYRAGDGNVPRLIMEGDRACLYE
jgi:hypothetical protein